jgi:glycosyltransferase involved in cell wall biosynthesis
MLSIVTINFNNAVGLKKTIDSLQSMRDSGFQWTFIDGGSTDSSLDLAKNFAETGDVIVSESDSGIYNAMNKGIGWATGDQIMFLNSGDELHSAIRSNQEMDLKSESDLHLFGFQIRGKTRLPRSNAWRVWSMPTSHQAIVYSAKLLRKHSFDESYRYAADFEHYLRINKSYLQIAKSMKPLIVNEPYGSDQNLAVVLDEYRRALIKNGYPRLWAQFVFWLKSRYLKIALGL